MKKCVPLNQLYQKIQGQPATNQVGFYTGQFFAISKPVPQGLVWIITLMDAVQAISIQGNPTTTPRPIQGYVIPQCQIGPQFATGNNAADKTFFGDWEGINDIPQSTSANRPPIVDAIRLDADINGGPIASGLQYSVGESKNLMPPNTKFLLLPEFWRVAAYTGIYDNSVTVGAMFYLRLQYYQLTIDQGNELLNS